MTNNHIDTQSDHDLTSHSMLDTEIELESNPENMTEPDTDTDTDTENNQTHYEKAETITDVSTEVIESAPPEMKKTDIVIAGVTYQIYCPIDGEEELRSAVYSINNFVLDIKKQSPKLSQENLLLLCCLNLSEQLHSQQAAEDSRRQDHEQSMALLQKIVKDAQSIAPTSQNKVS